VRVKTWTSIPSRCQEWRDYDYFANAFTQVCKERRVEIPLSVERAVIGVDCVILRVEQSSPSFKLIAEIVVQNFLRIYDRAPLANLI
jgi:hypothetical protein